MHLPTFSSRPLIGAAAIGCAALLAPAALATTISLAPGAAAAAGTPRCATSGLVVWLNTEGGGALGSIYYKLGLTNLSGHACTVRGYPGVAAVDLGGHQLGSAASRNNSHTPGVVRLPSGATATAVLGIVDAGNFPRSTCRQVTAAGLRVYPPNRTASNRTASKVIPFPFSACSRTGPVYLSVQAVHKA